MLEPKPKKKLTRSYETKMGLRKNEDLIGFAPLNGVRDHLYIYIEITKPT